MTFEKPSLFVLLITTAIVIADVNFLAVGDWGGQDVQPYYSEAQMESVTGMNTIAEKINAEFVIALGDNFYSDGIPTDASDPRFQQTYESVYTGAALQIDWYAISGNHDHRGNVTAQIAYTSMSTRWKYDAEFYAKRVTTEDGVSVDIFFIDTVELCGSPQVHEEHPDYFKPLTAKAREHTKSTITQWEWLEKQMASSTALYLLVAGHYPVYSVCEHGSTQTLVNELKPLLEKYGAHYFSGHDHCMEHLQETGSQINYFVTGMGKECCYDNTNIHKVPQNSLQWYIAANNRPSSVHAGFSSVRVTAESMTVTFYDQVGNVLYQAPPVAPRSSAA